MIGFNDSVSFFLSARDPALFKLRQTRVGNVQHHVTDFAMRPDDVSRCGIGAKRAPGSAGDKFDGLPFSCLRVETKTRRMSAIPPVWPISFRLRNNPSAQETLVPSHKRMSLEIHNCSGQRELVQDRAELLQVFS